jgi:CheY-like chemotaxis protein
LPSLVAEAHRRSESKGHVGKGRKRAKVLVVEDDAMNLELIHEVLAYAGYEIIEAATGPQALEAVERERPDLVLMDIQLPGVDGYELTKTIKADERFKDLPIVALTAFAMKGDDVKALEAGCDAYIPKPITGLRAFMATVRKYAER